MLLKNWISPLRALNQRFPLCVAASTRLMPAEPSVGSSVGRRWQSSSSSAVTLEMDKIRARGFLRYTYNYNPEPDIEQKIEQAAKKCGLDLDPTDWRTTKLADLDQKTKLLQELGQQLQHWVPNSKLHKMKTLQDLRDFYATPVSNITKYAEMARSDRLPPNLAIKEHPRRFHPNDKSATHGGVTAFPGEGGQVLGLRNKRLYRQFKPKKDWFQYEDAYFDHDVTCSKGMPWDPEVARRMDSYTEMRFTKKHLAKKNVMEQS